jgi:RNA-directed DNA polymerase
MAKRGREVDGRWEWTEPSVWTERMLDALERGVKGGKWYSLIDKVYAQETLAAAWKRVKRNRGSAGVDRETIDDFGRRAETRLARLAQQIEGDTYEAKPIRRTWIPKPGSSELRPLGIPTVTDRIAETALRMTIEPIFEQKFMECSYGFRPKRSTKDALRRVQQHLDAGRTFVVDIDIQKYFDTIDHGLLMEEVKKEVSDGRVLRMIEKSLSRGVMETTKSYAALEEGTPQGSVISPLLANIFLHPVDEAMTRGGYEVVRYADDCVVMCHTQEEAERAMSRMQELIAERRLTLHPDKTKLVDATASGGFDFLGYHFEQGRRTPRKKSLRKLKDAVREHTRRNNGYSLARIIDTLNPILRGWFEYFKHSARHLFGWLDAWIRGRLRSILRHRMGLRGRSRGRDHHRWRNAYFRQLGLFSMAEAHQLLIRSR